MRRAKPRFWPLEAFGHFGVLIPTAGKPKVAQFLTLEDAKAEAKRKVDAA